MGRRMFGGVIPSTRNFGTTGSSWSKFDDFDQMIAHSASAVTPSEQSSINTNKKSTTRFPLSLRWSSYVARLPKGGGQNHDGRFPSTIAIHLKKFCYKVSLCENCQRQSCRAFIGLTIMQKLLVWDVPFYLKFWVQVTALDRNRRFSLVAPQP